MSSWNGLFGNGHKQSGLVCTRTVVYTVVQRFGLKCYPENMVYMVKMFYTKILSDINIMIIIRNVS